MLGVDRLKDFKRTNNTDSNQIVFMEFISTSKLK